MRGQIAREFCFKEEVLPVLVISVLLNLLGPYLNHRFFGIPLVFLDMVGTAATAVLLGPWWAAAVGVLSNAFNGLALTFYFPFGVVNVVGGVVWGYWYRAYGAPDITAAGKKESIRYWVYLYLSMVGAGALAAGTLSTALKLILYPSMGLPLHYNKPIYLYALAKASQLGIEQYAEILSVWVVDLYRDLLDKGITAAIALVIVQGIGFIQRPFFPSGPVRVGRLERLKTDAESILVFVLTQFVYLLIARATVSEIHLPGAATPILWLRDPKIISLLYGPIVLAVLAFIFLTLDGSSRVGSAIESARRTRSHLYSCFRRLPAISPEAHARLDLLRFFNLKSIYGILLLIVVWPYRNDFGALGPVISAALYFGGAAVVSGLFFQEMRNFRKRYLAAFRWLETLHGWLSIRRQTQLPMDLLKIVAEIFQGQLVFSGEPPAKKGRLFYASCYNIAPSGLLYELRRSPSCEKFVVFAPGEPRTLSAEDVNHMRDILTWMQIRTGIAICNDPFFADAEALESVRRYQGLDLVLVPWQEIEVAVERYVRGESAALFVPEGSLRMAERLVRGSQDGWGWAFGEASIEGLARRALPAVRHQIDRLESRSVIADVGCGRGRHTLYALQRGHAVIAVDKNKKSVDDLKVTLTKWEREDLHVRLLNKDYVDVEPQELEGVDFLIAASVLHHARDESDLTRRVQYLRDVVTGPGGLIFIEMLFDMKFDGQTRPGRVVISVPEFEKLISEVFPAHSWHIERVAGPAYRILDFSSGGRSFFSEAKFVQQTSTEYLLKRLTQGAESAEHRAMTA